MHEQDCLLVSRGIAVRRAGDRRRLRRALPRATTCRASAAAGPVDEANIASLRGDPRERRAVDAGRDLAQAPDLRARRRPNRSRAHGAQAMSRTIVVDHLGASRRARGHHGRARRSRGSSASSSTCSKAFACSRGSLRGRHVDGGAGASCRASARSARTATPSPRCRRSRTRSASSVSPQTRTLRDLAFQGRNIESHALHVFCLALPDFLGHPSVISLAA